MTLRFRCPRASPRSASRVSTSDAKTPPKSAPAKTEPAKSSLPPRCSPPSSASRRPRSRSPTSTGKERTLAEFAGKTVVLEWNNFECPFVKKHYGSGNMQALQKEITGKGVVW